MNEGCPCEAVKDLKIIVERHDRQLNMDHVEFAEIKKDLQYIKEALDKKGKINMTAVSSVIQALCTLMVGIIAAKLGMGI